MKYKFLLILFGTFASLIAFADSHTILLAESNSSYTNQTIFYSFDLERVRSTIKEEWNTGKRITSLAYTANGWCVVLSNDSHMGMQTFNTFAQWPKDWIREKWDEKYYITSIAYSGDRWFIVMTQDSRFSGQSYKGGEWEELNPWIEDKWNSSYHITATVYDGYHWKIVMSKVDYIGGQFLSSFYENVPQTVQAKTWERGYCVQSLTFGNGLFVLVGCTYKQNNDRYQSLCIDPTNPSDFINQQGNQSHFIAFAGGGDSPIDFSNITGPVYAIRGESIQPKKYLASLDWLNFQAVSRQKSYSFKVGVKSNSKVDNVKIYVNGELDRGIVPVTNDGYDMVIDRTISLAQGNNHIRVVVTNQDGDAVIERDVEYQQTIQPPTNIERRIALIMGNSNYEDNDKKLRNPRNDARALASKLESLGFTIILSLDQTQKGMEADINRFATQARNYDVALFYYAGHGLQSEGYNYLIPTDAVIPTEEDIKYKCINTNMVLDKMEKAQCPMKIVILDACRNNPFTRGWHRGANQEGLNIMNAPKGTFIAFSTAPGDVAKDGTGKNSPYTTALLQTLDQPNLSITDFFQEVLEKVATSTNDQQTPWTSNSFRGKFYFNPAR